MAKTLEREEIESMEILRDFNGKSEIIDAIRARLAGESGTGKGNGFEWVTVMEDKRPDYLCEYHEYRYRGLREPLFLTMWYWETDEKTAYEFGLELRVLDDTYRIPEFIVERKKGEEGFSCRFSKGRGKPLGLGSVKRGLSKYNAYMRRETGKADRLLMEDQMSA